MSEVKLTIVELTRAIQGEIHGSVVDAVVAALSAEPETIAELEAALERYHKPCADNGLFARFCQCPPVDPDLEPWDAGVVIVDLAARIVAAESTYSAPSAEGEVRYYDGSKTTEVPIYYRVPEDWLFLQSLAEYEAIRRGKLQRRIANPQVDIHAVLYGRGLSEFIVTECLAAQANGDIPAKPTAARSGTGSDSTNDQGPVEPFLGKATGKIHARWLTTPRHDLQGHSPRDVMLAKREFIDFDLHTRMLQWSFLGEGPPCLARDSYAFCYAGCGTHECVVYYDLLRYLLVQCWHWIIEARDTDLNRGIAWLEESKRSWLELPQLEFDGRIPALIIENERRRLPIVVTAHDVLDEDCPLCRMIADDCEMGFGPTFWHLDDCNMDDEFVFSLFRTREEWEAERRKWESMKPWSAREGDNWQEKPVNVVDRLSDTEVLVVEEPGVQ